MSTNNGAGNANARERTATLPEEPRLDGDAPEEPRRQSQTRPFDEPEEERPQALEESPSGAVSHGAPRRPSGLHERYAPLEEDEALSKAVGTSRTMRGGTMRPSVEVAQAWIRDHEIPRPGAEARSGHIWPGASRSVLAAIPWEDVCRVDGYESDVLHQGAHVFRAGGWRLEAQPPRSDDDSNAARIELSRRARVQMVLGPLKPSRVILAVAFDGDDAPWLWTMTPWAPSLADSLADAYHDGDERRLGDVLCIYGVALALGLRVEIDKGVKLTFHARNFVLGDDERPRYCDVGYGDDRVARATALLGPALAYGGAPAAIERYGSTMVQRFASFSATQLAGLDLLPALASASVGGDVATRLRSRLVGAVKQ